MAEAPGFHLQFSVASRDLQNIRHAQRPQLANLPCARIIVRDTSADELVVFSTRRVGKHRSGGELIFGIKPDLDEQQDHQNR